MNAAHAIVKGLAPDGGLMTPCVVSRLPSSAFNTLKDMNYQQRVLYIMSRFLTGFSTLELTRFAAAAYGKNKFSEIHNAAREIVRLVRDNGYRYRDISIIARDVEMYKSIVDRVFPTYEIPVFADRKMPLSGHSIAMYIASVIDVVLGGFSYENIFMNLKEMYT